MLMEIEIAEPDYALRSRLENIRHQLSIKVPRFI